MKSSFALPFIVGLSLALLCGCDSATPLATAPTTLVSGDQAQLQKTVDGLIAQVATIRGLTWKRPVLASWTTRQHLPALLDSLAGSRGSGGGSNSDEIFQALGYLDPSVSLEAALSQFDSTGVAAFYEQGTDHLWVVTDQANSGDLTHTIVHELVHALQDQVFGDSVSDTAELDEYEAFQLLEEGEAEYVATLWSMGNPTAATFDQNYSPWNLFLLYDWTLSQPTISNLPLVVTLPSLAPYTCGVTFVHQVHLQSGWAGVDSLHRKHPMSTRQTLHVPRGDLHKGFVDWGYHIFASLPDWDTLGSGRLGELYLTTLLYSQGNPALTGDASGWNGDRFWIWRTRDSLHHAVVGRISTDSASIAASLLQRWGEAFSRRVGQSVPLQGLDSFHLVSSDSQSVVRGVRHGSELYLAFGDLHGSRLDSIWTELASLSSSPRAAGRALAPTVAPLGPRWRGPRIHPPWPGMHSAL